MIKITVYEEVFDREFMAYIWFFFFYLQDCESIIFITLGIILYTICKFDYLWAIFKLTLAIISASQKYGFNWYLRHNITESKINLETVISLMCVSMDLSTLYLLLSSP